jgi:hypothetical protein
LTRRGARSKINLSQNVHSHGLPPEAFIFVLIRGSINCIEGGVLEIKWSEIGRWRENIKR